MTAVDLTNVDGEYDDCRHECDGQFFSRWAREAESGRLREREYFVRPDLFSDLSVKRMLFQSKALASVAKGSNMEVFIFDGEKLRDCIIELFRVGKNEEISRDSLLYGRISDFVETISSRYVVKVGMVDYFHPRMGDSAMNIKRHNAHRGFAKVGFEVMPTHRRTEKNLCDVVRMNLYAGNEGKSPITAVSISTEIVKFVSDPNSYSLPRSSDVMYAEDDSSHKMNVTDIYRAVFPDDPIDDHSQYCDRNRAKRVFRSEEFNDLEDFFSTSITAGWYSVVRNVFFGYHHTDLDYEQAAGLMAKLCEKYEDESFMIPEQVTYGYDPRLCDPNKISAMLRDNDCAVLYFQQCFKRVVPEPLRGIFSNPDVMLEFCQRVMAHAHEIPEYEVCESKSVLSLDMLKFLAEAIYLYFFEPDPELRKDFDADPMLAEFFDHFNDEQRRCLSFSIAQSLFMYKAASDVEKCPKYHHFHKTVTKVQQNLKLLPDGMTRVINGPMTIADLVTKHSHLLIRYLEISEKLAVYFYRMYRLCKETSYLPDHRPAVNLFRNVILGGEWATLTENIHVTICEDAFSEPHVFVTNNDPEDSFRISDSDVAESAEKPTLAENGFGLANVVGGTSFIKAFARFLDVAADHNGVEGVRKGWPQVRRLQAWANDRVSHALDLKRLVSRLDLFTENFREDSK